MRRWWLLAALGAIVVCHLLPWAVFPTLGALAPSRVDQALAALVLLTPLVALSTGELTPRLERWLLVGPVWLHTAWVGELALVLVGVFPQVPGVASLWVDAETWRGALPVTPFMRAPTPATAVRGLFASAATLLLCFVGGTVLLFAGAVYAALSVRQLCSPALVGARLEDVMGVARLFDFDGLSPPSLFRDREIGPPPEVIVPSKHAGMFRYWCVVSVVGDRVVGVKAESLD